MWDLIVSVPDHCFFLLFIKCFTYAAVYRNKSNYKQHNDNNSDKILSVSGLIDTCM